MQSSHGTVEGEGGWKRIASQLEAEVRRLHGMLEATQNTNLELERQSTRLALLEGGNLLQQQRDGYPQYMGGNNDDQHHGNSALSPVPPPPPQGPSQPRMETIYLPRPHSRSSSPVVSRMTGPAPAQVQGFLPGSATARPGGSDGRQQLSSRASLRSVQAQLSQQDLDAAKGQAAWHERERHRAALQVNRLYDELEAARAEATRLKEQLQDRDRHWGGQEQTWAQVREEARERQERFDALAAERGQLVTRVDVLEKEKVEMRQHITKLDMYLVNVARELDEVRDARGEMEERVRRLKGTLTASEAHVALLSGELQGLAKGVTRVLGSRKGLDATYARMGALLERLRSMGLQEAVVDMARHGGGERGGGGAHWDKWVGSVRRMATEANNLTTQLGQEVDAARRESELVAGDLTDLLTRVQRALGKAGGRKTKGGAQGGEGEDRGPPLADKLRQVDDQAEETGRHLRELLRGRVASLQAQLREAYEARADVEAENERLGKEARGAVARMGLLEEEEQRLRMQVEELTTQLQGLVSERRAAGEAALVQRAELGDLRPRLTSAEKEAAHLRESLEQLRRALSAAVGDSKTAKEERDVMAEQLGHRNGEVEGLRRKVEALEWEVDEAGKALGGGREEVGALRAEVGRAKSGTARVVDLLVAERGRASKATVFAAWVEEVRRAGLRRWRLRLLGRMAGVLRAQRAEEERLRAEVEEGEVRGQVEQRRAFVEAFRRHVAGKRARGWAADREELRVLRERMEVWGREGVPPEERARIEGEVEELGRGLELAHAQVQAYATELQRVREQAEERIGGLEEEVERERRDARLLREDGARMCREAEDRAEGLQDQLQAMGEREEQLRQELADQQAEMEGLRGRLREEGEASEALRQRLEELQDEGHRREEAAKASRREWEEALHQQRLEAEVARMSAWQEAEVKIGTGLRERLAAAEGEREAARSEAQRLREEVRKGEEERHRYGLRQRELEMVIKATTEEYVRLQQALASAGTSPGKGGERGGEGEAVVEREGSRLPIFSAYGCEGDDDADVADLNARLIRSEAGRAEVVRQLEDARAEIARLKQELAALAGRRPTTEGEGPLRRRIEELQQEAARLRQAGGAAGDGKDKEEKMHALRREVELVTAARQQLQDTVALQQHEIAALVEQSRVAEGRLGAQSRRLEALEQEREAGEALRHSQDGVLRDLRNKVAALSRENEGLRALERARESSSMAGGAAPAYGLAGEQDLLRLSGASDASSLRQCLDASEAENQRLRQALHRSSAEREEFSTLCQTLRDEMLAVAGQTPGGHHLSPMVLRTNQNQDQNQAEGNEAPQMGPSPVMANAGSAYVSPTQVESFRQEVQAKEREVEKLRSELQRELALRRELEAEGEKAREEREERARVIARELGEAMHQRDQAAHTAHSLETALKCSQERIDYLIRENSSIKDGLKALEKKIVAHPSHSHAAPPRRPRLLVPPPPVDPESDDGDDSLLFADSPKAKGGERRPGGLGRSSEPEWSPSSNAARRAGGWDDSQASDKDKDKTPFPFPFHDEYNKFDKQQDTSGPHTTNLFDHSTGEEGDDHAQDGPVFGHRPHIGGRRSRSPSPSLGDKSSPSSSSDDERYPQRRSQYELASSCGGRAFLVSSSRPSSKPHKSKPHNSNRAKSQSPVQAPQAPGEGARLEVLRMLHSAEAEVQATLSRQLPVDPALKDYIHELKDALRRLEETEDLHPRQSN